LKAGYLFTGNELPKRKAAQPSINQTRRSLRSALWVSGPNPLLARFWVITAGQVMQIVSRWQGGES